MVRDFKEWHLVTPLVHFKNTRPHYYLFVMSLVRASCLFYNALNLVNGVYENIIISIW